MATEKKAKTARVTVVDDDVVIPVQIGKRTKLITRQSIAERMHDDYEDRHGTGRDYDDDEDRGGSKVMSTPVTTAPHEFVGDPRDACTDCGFSVYHSNHNTKQEGKSEACSKGHHGVCVDKACTCLHHQIRDAAIQRTETPAEPTIYSCGCRLLEPCAEHAQDAASGTVVVDYERDPATSEVFTVQKLAPEAEGTLTASAGDENVDVWRMPIGSEAEGADEAEAAFQAAMVAWDSKPKREQRILSPRRHFFEAGHAVADAQVARLREALRGVSGATVTGWGECWCQHPSYKDHTLECAAARKELEGENG